MTNLPIEVIFRRKLEEKMRNAVAKVDDGIEVP